MIFNISWNFNENIFISWHITIETMLYIQQLIYIKKFYENLNHYELYVIVVAEKVQMYNYSLLDITCDWLSLKSYKLIISQQKHQILITCILPQTNSSLCFQLNCDALSY